MVNILKDKNGLTLIVGDKVAYYNGRIIRSGEIIELAKVDKRVRVKWDNRRPRTWIRTSALEKLFFHL